LAEAGGEQKLAAILAADVAGYTRLMADDEPATIATITEYRTIFSQHIEANGGRVVDMAGDSILTVFTSAAGAVKAAVDAQADLAPRNHDLPEARRMRFRVGVNLGDIRETDDGRVYGDGVNVAARLEGLAEPGGVMISEDAHRQVRRNPDLAFADAGSHEVKNVAEPVRAYRVLAEGEVAPTLPKTSRVWQVALAGAAMALVAIVAIALWPAPDTLPEPEVATIEPDGTLPPLPTGPAIAVLPFDNLGGDPEQEYFADGLAEDILTRLAAFRELKVIARNSSFQYKGEAVDVREVGRQLGADFVLEGSVRRDASSIRVSAQLLDTEEGGHVWAETYDRDLSASSIFEIQDEITEQVVAALGGTHGAITAGGIRRLHGGGTESLQSYECVLLAHQYLNLMTEESHLAARTCLVDVVEQEPDYVEGLVALGHIYMNEVWSGYNPRDTGLPSVDAADEVARRAIQLDPGHQWARRVMAWVYFTKRDKDQYYEQAQKAIAVNPNDVSTVAEAAMWLGYAGWWEESEALTLRLRSLVKEVPNWHNYTEFNYHYRDRDYAAAAKSARATLEIEHWAGPWYLALAHAGNEENDKAIEALAKARALEPDLNTETVRGMVDALFLDEVHIALLMDGHTQLMALEESLATQRPVIAVLPFDNMSGDPEQEYFADGITEDIITRLSRFTDLKVIARNSTFQYKGQAVDVRTLGEDLGATHVIEGSVRRLGERLRVTVQLLNAADGAHLWAESYDRAYDIESLFDIQDGITNRIVSNIADTHGALDRSALQALSDSRPETLDAYDCILVARGYQGAAGPEMAERALTCLEAVTVSEPGYAEAWAWLAHMYSEFAVFWSPGDDSMPVKAESAARRSIEIDPSNQRAHLVMAMLYFGRQDCVGFGAEADQAISANPNHAETLMEIGWRVISCGGWDEAVAIMLKLIEINDDATRYPHGLLSFACYQNGDYDCAIAEAKKAEIPGFYFAYIESTIAYVGAGRLDDARDAAQKIESSNPDFAAIYWEDLGYWFFAHPDFMDSVAADLRTAGLDIPERPDE
jgi:adenylate cyclase